MTTRNPNPRRVAAGWLGRLARFNRQSGIIQAPPALVDAVSQWVVSTVSLTSKREVEEATENYKVEVKGRKNLAVAKIMKAVRQGLADKLGVRALWALVDLQKEGTLASEAMRSTGILGYNLFRGITFAVFSKDYKAGSPWLLSHLEALDGFLAGEDDDTKRRFADYAADLKRLDQFIYPGVKVTPLLSGVTTREFDLFKFTQGWRYAEILTNPAYLGESRVLQLRKSQREVQKSIAMIKAKAQGQTEAVKGIIEMMQETHKALEKQIQEAGKSQPSFSAVTVVLTLSQATRAKASWHPHERKVTIYYPRSASNWDLDDLRQSVRHELQHMAQTLLQESLKVETAGLPPLPTLTPQFKQWMNQPEEGNPYRQNALNEVMKGLDGQGLLDIDFGYGRMIKRKPKDFDFHALDDIEFFTRLQDALADFQKIKRSVKLDQATLNNALDLFSGKIEMPQSSDKGWYEKIEALGGYDSLRGFGTHRFFSELHRMPAARLKYERAIKELRKEFGYTGGVR